MANPIYALVIAGGSGERFWPLSRRARPKQLLRLVSEKALLEETVERIDGWVPQDRILILTNIEQEAAVRDLLKDFPKENILAEPVKRDTAAAIALGAGWVALRDHTATMIVLPADHLISNREAFQETMSWAATTAEETGGLVTIGIKPTWACPGFGYIEQGEPIHLRTRADKGAVHRVLRFREKPNTDLAESFLRKGNFRWNAGMFIWSFVTITEGLQKHQPEMAEACQRWFKVAGTPKLARVLAKEYPEIKKISSRSFVRRANSRRCYATASANFPGFHSTMRSWKRRIASWS